MTSGTIGKVKKNQDNSSLRENVYIKKVILENFLSFQKDEVEFGENQLIYIIGPNWSGKTTIFQAIKFVLGSNERGERYPKWSDFIRHGQKHALVEIHFQNQEEKIQIRRTVIKGQSPFFSIKKRSDKSFRRAQAIEIQDLVSSLNYNPDNQFAFVSQGKIDAIKNLKPQELCIFLEEGIGLKNLREEILQQKSKVLNLHRELNSLKGKRNTLNINLELLRPKLERLEEKKKLLEIKKGYNDELLWANRQKLLEDIVNLAEIIKKIKKKVREIKAKKEELDILIDQLNKKTIRIEGKINFLSEKLGEKRYKKQELIDKIQTWQKDKIKKKEELDSLTEKITDEEKAFQNFKKQKESIEKELNLIRKEKNNVEKKFDELLKEQKDLTTKIEINKKFLEDYDSLILNKRRLLNAIQENKKEIKGINDQINQVFQSFKDIEHKLEKNRWFLKNPTRDLLKELDNELREVSLELYDIESKLKQLEIDKVKKFKNLSFLQDSLRERRIILPTNINILKEEISKRELKVKGPIIEYLKYDDELSYAIESILGERVLYSFIANDWDTLSLLKRLKNKYNAYCNIYVPKHLNIIPLPKMTGIGVVGYLVDLIKIVKNDIDIKKVIYSVVKNCLVVKDFRSGKELYKSTDFKGKCVTLKGEQIISHRYVYETPHVKKLKGFLSSGTQREQAKALEHDIKRINDEISELNVEASKLDNIQKDMFRKKESFNDLLYSFNQKRRLTSKKNQLYENRTNLEEKNSTIKEKIKDLDVDIKKLESQKDPEFFKWNDRLKQIPAILTALNEEKKQWDQNLSENLQYITEVQEKINHHNSNLRVIKAEYKAKKDEFQKADKRAFEIYQELEVVESDMDILDQKMKNFKEKRIEVHESKNKLDKAHIEINFNLEQEMVKLNKTELEFQMKNEDLKRIDSEIGPLITEEKIQPRKIEDIREDIMKIDKELLKYYDVDEFLLIERDQIMASLKDLAKNQKSLDDDVKAAIKAEDKLEDTYYEKFKVVLNELQSNINRKFKSNQINVYCSLELIGNFEELGVDIKASTSRNQLISCTALSGGQISMISIGLILSLQEIKPSPLCMFDEAGMFLDDKNSEIAYKLFKSTLQQRPIQMIMFLPKASSTLYGLAEKIIGVARVGKKEVSTIFRPKIIEKEE